MSHWEDEYYGDCSMAINESKDAKTVMKIGEIAIWPPGKALCFFFGPTPISSDEKPVAASKVNPIGMIENPSQLKKLGSSILVKIASEKNQI